MSSVRTSPLELSNIKTAPWEQLHLFWIWLVRESWDWGQYFEIRLGQEGWVGWSSVSQQYIV